MHPHKPRSQRKLKPTRKRTSKRKNNWHEKFTFGGSLETTRRCRERARPLACRHSMHLVLRSSQAKGDWSFRRHRKKVRDIVHRFAKKYRVEILSMANVGNHLHFHIQLARTKLYTPFIRALTAALMMAVTGASRWHKPKLKGKFWDRRPFTRIVFGIREWANVAEYIEINQLQGEGHPRHLARYMVKGPAGARP